MYHIAAIAVALSLAPPIWASTVRIVALGATAHPPSEWVLQEDAGPRGCAFEVTNGGRLEVVVWELSVPHGDARHAAWEHSILLQRSCGFRAQREEAISLPWGAQAVRVLGISRENGSWAGAFLAFVVSPGKACVIGCFMPGAEKIQAAADAVATFIAGLEMPGGVSPVLAGSLPLVPSSFAVEVALGEPALSAHSRLSKPAAAPRMALLRPQVSEEFFTLAELGTVGREPEMRIARIPDRATSAVPPTLGSPTFSEATPSPINSEKAQEAIAPTPPVGVFGDIFWGEAHLTHRLGKPARDVQGVPVVAELGEGAKSAARSSQMAVTDTSHPEVKPALIGENVELGLLHMRWQPSAQRGSLPGRALLLSATDTRPQAGVAGATTASAQPSTRGPRLAVPDAVHFLVSGSRPVIPLTCATDATGQEAPLREHGKVAVGQRTSLPVLVRETSPFILEPLPQLAEAATAGLTKAGASVVFRGSRPEGNVVVAAGSRPYVEAELAGSVPAPVGVAQVATARSGRGSRPIGVVELAEAPRSLQPVASHSAVRGAVGTVARSEGEARSGQPAAKEASVGTAAAVSAGPGPALAEGPAPAAGASRERHERVTVGMSSRPGAAPLAAAVAARPAVVAASTSEPAVGIAVPGGEAGRALTAPSRSAPTAGWARDLETGCLEIPVPLGWMVAVSVKQGPAGPAITVEGVHSSDQASRFWWIQPALPMYRELSQLLMALGYREWQVFQDTGTGIALTVANRRPAKRYLEDVVLADSRRGLLGWQILDAQASDVTGSLLEQGEGVVAHVLGSSPGGSTEGWYAVATGNVPDLPHYVWAGAWLGAQSRPGKREVLKALAQVVSGGKARGDNQAEVQELLRRAQGALADLLRAAVPQP
jgi:hypothetical protein